jgi:hemoglobin
VETLFARLGGEAAIEAAVVRFYDKVMADPTLSPFFAHLDLENQIRKQIAFLTLAFGGPNNYTGRQLRTAHAPLGLSEQHFDAVANHLKDTLEELGVDPSTIGEVLGVVAGTRKDVLGQ